MATMAGGQPCRASRLPDIHEGPNKWMRDFEEETVGTLLALGDIKAVWTVLWTPTVWTPTMKSILRHSGKEWMLSPTADGTDFSAYRSVLWMALRADYPPMVDQKS